MDFVSESYSFANIDGRIVLRATIDRPLNSAHNAFEYLSLYSASISKFVSSVLVSSAREAYCASIRAGARFLPYSKVSLITERTLPKAYDFWL